MSNIILPSPVADSPRISTGVTGLDEVLHGGFPQGHVYLLEGKPGTGKTTIALQFLLAGVRIGEPCLYITFSESAQELQEAARSHGWTLDSLAIFEFTLATAGFKADEEYTVFHPAEVELGDFTQTLRAEVERLQLRRVVMDSLSELRLLAGDSLRYRRQVLALKEFFTGLQCTVLFLDDLTAREDDLQLRSIVHGVILLEQVPLEYGTKRRRLDVIKLRGSQFREGYQDYIIRPGGVVAFPRLASSSGARDIIPKEQDVVSNGVAALDALLGGGLSRGTSTLVMGPAGVGKSSVALSFAVAAAERGEFTSVYSFDQNLMTLRAQALGLGMDLSRLLAAKRMRMEQIDPAELSPGEFVQQVRHAVEEDQARVVLVDSLNGFLNAMPGEKSLNIQLYELLAFLNHHGVATLLVMTQYGILGTSMNVPVDVSYLTDAVLLLRYFEARGQIRQAIVGSEAARESS